MFWYDKLWFYIVLHALMIMMSGIEFGHPHTRMQYVARSNQLRHPND